jgi:hypothetical protein
MTLLSAITRPKVGFALILLTLAATGCAKHSQATSTANVPIQSMQTNGFMSQTDYDKIRQVQANVSQNHAISDSDLDWTIGFLKSATNPIARARAFTALSEVHPMSESQNLKSYRSLRHTSAVAIS